MCIRTIPNEGKVDIGSSSVESNSARVYMLRVEVGSDSIHPMLCMYLMCHLLTKLMGIIVDLQVCHLFILVEHWQAILIESSFCKLWHTIPCSNCMEESPSRLG